MHNKKIGYLSKFQKHTNFYLFIKSDVFMINMEKKDSSITAGAAATEIWMTTTPTISHSHHFSLSEIRKKCLENFSVVNHLLQNYSIFLTLLVTMAEITGGPVTVTRIPHPRRVR